MRKWRLTEDGFTHGPWRIRSRGAKWHLFWNECRILWGKDTFKECADYAFMSLAEKELAK